MLIGAELVTYPADRELDSLLCNHAVRSAAATGRLKK